MIHVLLRLLLCCRFLLSLTNSRRPPSPLFRFPRQLLCAARLLARGKFILSSLSQTIAISDEFTLDEFTLKMAKFPLTSFFPDDTGKHSHCGGQSSSFATHARGKKVIYERSGARGVFKTWGSTTKLRFNCERTNFSGVQNALSL